MCTLPRLYLYFPTENSSLVEKHESSELSSNSNRWKQEKTGFVSHRGMGHCKLWSSLISDEKCTGLYLPYTCYDMFLSLFLPKTLLCVLSQSGVWFSITACRAQSCTVPGTGDRGARVCPTHAWRVMVGAAAGVSTGEPGPGLNDGLRDVGKEKSQGF